MEISSTPTSVFEAEIAAVSDFEWQSELKKSAERYHWIGAWVAIIFDPLFGITDYLNIPDAWEQIFAIRISVALLTLGAIWLFKQKRISTYLFIAIPLFLISLQNAFTYQFIGPETMLGHNLNYLALFLGAGLFILWPLVYSLIAIGVSAVASFGFILLNPNIAPGQFAVEGGILLVTAVIFSILLIQARYNSRMREIKSRLALEKALLLTASQRDEIEEKKEILERQAADLKRATAEIELVNAKLEDQNANLEELVEKRTAALRKTSTERDTLIYRLSHDFKTPMVNIRSMVNLVEQFPDSEQRDSFFKKIYHSLNQFDGLVRDLESFPVYARRKLEMADLDFEGMVEAAWENLAGLRETGDSYTIAVESDAALVSDREKIAAVVHALLSNSLLFRKAEQPVAIDITVRPTSSGHSISFRDNGAGIPSGIQDRVFELFFRGDKRSKGTGLGLYLVQGIAGQLGGEAKILSQEGVGTEVVVGFLNPSNNKNL